MKRLYLIFITSSLLASCIFDAGSPPSSFMDMGRDGTSSHDIGDTSNDTTPNNETTKDGINVSDMPNDGTSDMPDGGCPVGFADCDGDTQNGCETDLNSDLSHCGACNSECTLTNAESSCTSGICNVKSCNVGFENCDNQAPNGCETNINTNAQNCGACGTICSPPNNECAAGQCQTPECSAGTADCDAAIDGCETDITSSQDHCGACNQPCSIQHATSSCQQSICELDSCNAPFDDCNNNPNDGCEANTDTDMNHCGTCGNVCNLPHAASTACNAGTCEITTCDTNYHDIDQNPANGCEYQCVFQSSTDLPDDLFVDANCDGIDGDITHAIFVSESGNNANNGSMSHPVKTIKKGIELANTQGKHVYVANGTYVETSTLVLANGVSIYGGYDPTTWVRSSTLAVVDIDDTIGVSANGMSTDTVLDFLEFRSASATVAGDSSYGLFVANSNHLIVKNCKVVSGNGMEGVAGQSPASSFAAFGDPGGRGEEGCENGSAFCGSCSRPVPGAAGTNSTCSANTAGGRGGRPGLANNDGETGINAPGGTSAGEGTPPKKGNWNPEDKHVGARGTEGNPGTDGAPFSITYTALGYFAGAGHDGTAGTPGTGGGGGGGGGGGVNVCRSYGGAGGGGGAGGCGGKAAMGGTGGGGSFAIYLSNSDITVTRCKIISGKGGDGGMGGTGQQGGDGGLGGRTTDHSKPNAGNNYNSDQDDGSNGGKGGNGGRGGNGGHGAGGNGGPSICIFGLQSVVNVSNIDYQPSEGGAGGQSSGNDGHAGTKANIQTQ